MWTTSFKCKLWRFKGEVLHAHWSKAMRRFRQGVRIAVTYVDVCFKNIWKTVKYIVYVLCSPYLSTVLANIKKKNFPACVPVQQSNRQLENPLLWHPVRNLRDRWQIYCHLFSGKNAQKHKYRELYPKHRFVPALVHLHRHFICRSNVRGIPYVSLLFLQARGAQPCVAALW